MAYRYPTVKINGKTKLKHRHVAEQKIGRPLRRDEHVHHLDGDEWNCAPENLEVLTPSEHMQVHKQKHPRTKLCQNCGAEFTPHPTKRERAKSCSRKCAYELVSKSLIARNQHPPLAEAIVRANFTREPMRRAA